MQGSDPPVGVAIGRTMEGRKDSEIPTRGYEIDKKSPRGGGSQQATELITTRVISVIRAAGIHLTDSPIEATEIDANLDQNIASLPSSVS